MWRNRLIPKIFLLPFFCLLLCACASVSVFEDLEVRTIEPGLEIIVGRNTGGGIGWTAVRSRFNIAVSLPKLSGEMTLSGHGGEPFSNPDIIAALTGSPHNPIRLRSGLPQNAAGIYQAAGKQYSIPDGRHDALGIEDSNQPVLLDPSMQMDWSGDAIGGFYIILENGTAVSPVPVRDAISAVGWSDDRSTIIFLVIKGRDGVGFSYEEAGILLQTLGANQGLAMDGGGSARLVWRENQRIYSFPAGRFYRAVPNHLLIVAGSD